MIGPVVLPTPPITTMKITSAVQRSTLKAESARADGLLSRITAPVAPGPEGGHHPHDQPGAGHVDAEAPGAVLAVAHRPQRRGRAGDRSTSTTMAVAPTASASASQ